MHYLPYTAKTTATANQDVSSRNWGAGKAQLGREIGACTIGLGGHITNSA